MVAPNKYPDEFLTIAETAEMLKLHPKNVWRLIRAGALPAKEFQIAGQGKRQRYRILLSAVKTYMFELPDFVTAMPTAREPKTKAPAKRRGNLPGVTEFV